VSPHRALVAPLVNYIWTLHQQRPDLTLTVAVPEVAVRHWWHQILHDRIAWRLQRAAASARSRRHQRAIPPDRMKAIQASGSTVVFLRSSMRRTNLPGVPGRVLRIRGHVSSPCGGQRRMAGTRRHGRHRRTQDHRLTARHGQRPRGGRRVGAGSAVARS
jgi:hypothetical protein